MGQTDFHAVVQPNADSLVSISLFFSTTVKTHSAQLPAIVRMPVVQGYSCGLLKCCSGESVTEAGADKVAGVKETTPEQ